MEEADKIFEDYLTYTAGVRQFTKATINSYKNDLQIFKSWLKELNLKVFEVSASDIRIFAAELGDKKFAPASINRLLSVLRGFYKYAVRFNLTKVNPATGLRNLKIPLKLPVFMFPAQAQEFCALPENKNILWEARDAALFASLYSTGCRVSELAGLDIKDLNFSFSSAIVFGKGKKERKVFFADFAKDYLKIYLKERKMLLKKHQGEVQTGEDGKTRDALFLNKRGKPLTIRGIRYIINRYVEISPELKRLSPHAFRHSFASTLVTRGADIRVVQELLGHASVSTTQRYTHITAEQLHSLYKKAHPHS
ncbi:tyrosine recombinase XerC [Treponema pedis]|uniref:tyrosine recombinase XerC n=1 Tax=Treponema pedis TaxID=409322 RepID=UPI000409A3A1|nr:tyrosine recombinase XerC [Treponema pedis]